MVRRVCRELGNKKNIVVINDEAHHCYRRKPEDDDAEAEARPATTARKPRNATRKRASGSPASRPSKPRSACKAIYDLSATPFFLRGSGYPEGTLFPWVVSDFSLIDAIESGIVKVPRVPVADDSMQGDQPTYRDLWLRIREHLPKKGRKTEELDGEPQAAGRARRGAPQPLRQLREVSRALGAERRRPGQGPDAAGLHRRLQQHQRLQARLRLHRRLGEDDRRRRRPSSSPASCRIFSNEKDGSLEPAPEHDPGRLRAARIGRGHERRVQEDRRPRDRGVQGRIPRPLPRPRRREPDRRRPAARGDEHRRQARQARRARQVRRLRLDAHRGLGRQHRHPRPGRPRLRHPAPLRAGRRPRPAPDELRRQRRGPLRARIRRGLRRAVLVHPLLRLDGQPQARPDADARPRPREPRRLRDHLSRACSATATSCRRGSSRPSSPRTRGCSLTTADMPTKTENAPIVGESSIHTLDDLKKRRRARSPFCWPS